MKYGIIAAAGLSVVLLMVGLVFLIRRLIGRSAEKRIAAYQNALMEQHYHEVENMYRQMRGWRHDYHNHIQTMKAYLSMGQTEKLEGYLASLDQDLTKVDTVVKTGNVMVDAILNSKLSMAQAKGIAIHAKATVDPDVSIAETDLCVILGNLLDNAMEACLKQEGEAKRFIRVYIGKFKGQFYISVSNSVGGAIQKQNGAYQTTKSGSHGFGLRRVDALIDKYGGYLNRQDEGDVFATEVMLPIG